MSIKSRFLIIVLSLHTLACQSFGPNYSYQGHSLSHHSQYNVNTRSCTKIIKSYMQKAIYHYKLKKMVVRNTTAGTFIVPQKSLMTYMVIMKPAAFNRFYEPKERDQRFYCMNKGQKFKGVYHLYRHVL